MTQMAVFTCELTASADFPGRGKRILLTHRCKWLEGRLGMTLKTESLGRMALKDENSGTYLEAELGS